MEEFFVIIFVERESVTTVGASDDEDAVSAHLAEFSDIAEDPLGAQMTADAFNGRGSRESHIVATFHAYRTYHSLWRYAARCNSSVSSRNALLAVNSGNAA